MYRQGHSTGWVLGLTLSHFVMGSCGRATYAVVGDVLSPALALVFFKERVALWPKPSHLFDWSAAVASAFAGCPATSATMSNRRGFISLENM